MITAVIAAGASALGYAVSLTPAVRWLGRRVGGLVCRPASGPPDVGRVVPRSGSLVLMAAVLVGTAAGWLLLHQPTNTYATMLGASALIMLGGLVDDWLHELGIVIKMAIQIAAACILIGQGVRTQIGFLPSWANVLLTMVWVVGVTNACNLLDILDGLVLGVACIIAVTFAWIAVAEGDAAAVLCAAIAGGALGLWRYNRQPASIFLGDAGAQWLGFLFAATAISLHYAPPERPVALLTPLIVLAVPLFDTAFVIMQRLRHGRSVLAKSADHYALRWIARGRTQAQAAQNVWALGLVCAAAALTVYYTPNGVGAVTTVAVAAWLLWVWRSADRLPEHPAAARPPAARLPKIPAPPEQARAESPTP